VIKIFYLFLINSLLTCFYFKEVKTNVITYYSKYALKNNIQLNYIICGNIKHMLIHSNNTLTQGYQQPYYNIMQIKPQTNSSFNINIFPNPGNDELYIKNNSSQTLAISSNLYDITGKLIISHIQLINEKHLLSLPMKNVAAGKYLLNIYCKEINEQFSFEVIKH